MSTDKDNELLREFLANAPQILGDLKSKRQSLQRYLEKKRKSSGGSKYEPVDLLSESLTDMFGEGQASIHGETYSGNEYTADKYGFCCTKCGRIVPLGKCTNCGGTAYKPKPRSISCKRCEKEHRGWICPGCREPHMIEETLVKKADGCFIATASIGSTTSWQVCTLQQFRDTVLVSLQPGRAFVRWYYDWSPSKANYLSSHPRLRWVVGWLVTFLSCTVMPTTWAAIWLKGRQRK